MGPGAKLIYLVRHGQGYHDLEPQSLNEKIRDPSLTEKGQQQALAVRLSFPHHDSIKLLCSSPMRRALQTAISAFEPELRRGMRILALPEAQEASLNLSDLGSDLQAVKGEFGEEVVDFGLVGVGWEVHEGLNSTDPESVRKRAKRMRCFLFARPEEVIVLMAHGYFIHFLTGDVDEKGSQTCRSWGNLEWRSYELAGEAHDPCLLETEESSRRRVECSN